MRHNDRVEEGCRASDRESGAAVVEFAIVGLVFFTLVFSLLDYGIFFNAHEAIRHGVREASRTAIVNLVPINTSCNLQLATAASPEEKSLLCLVKTKIGQGTGSRVYIQWPESGDVQGDHLTICAMYATPSASGLTAPFLPKRVTSEVKVRLEQNFTDSGSPPGNAQENASSGDWSFCT
jgi:Flp pilus assembly protein TadG